MTPAPAPVSAVVPCWRCGATIERALRTILAQTRPVAEILLVDDASGDGTLAALGALRDRLGDPRIQVIALEANGGPGAARNAGWELATQRWVAFLDADDGWHPRKIELQVGWLEDHAEVALCAHDTALWGGALPQLPDRATDARRIAARSLLFRNSIPTRSVILRRDLPYRFADRHVAEDYLLWLEIVLDGHACYRLPQVLAWSFRPEFSRGGYSGDLWAHEKRELAGYRRLRASRRIGVAAHVAASTFSFLKYLRRTVVASRRGGGDPA